MALFTQAQADKYAAHESEVLLIDRIVEEANKVLLQDEKPDLHKIKSTLFDLVVLKRLLDKLGVAAEFLEPIKSIRDSIAHVDERLDIFDFEPTTIVGKAWSLKNSGGGVSLSSSHNFQGAITKARISTSGEVMAVGPYGMVDDNFIWIDRNGKQRHASVKELKDAYLVLIRTAAQSLGRLGDA